MNKTTLVIMAAGLGSRFGGLKQTQSIGPNDEFLLHYSIYDALKAGFNKIVFVIKKENLQFFKEKVGKLIEKQVEVYYVFQDNNIKNIPKDRIKPLGTGHCIYCIKDIVKEKFAIITSDDFYGRDAFKILYNELNKNDDNFYLVGYHLKKTLSDYGSVKRGICIANGNNLKDILECKVENNDSKLNVITLHSRRQINVNKDTLVSMGMYGFNTKIIEYVKENIFDFFNKNSNNIYNVEYFLPEVVSEMINKKLVNVKVLNTNNNWFGITYKEDLINVKKKINELIKSGEYPSILFK